MVNFEINKMERILRERLGRFVSTDSKQHYPQLYSMFEYIRDKNYPAFLCGGAVRNMLLSNKNIPRDLDIILGYISKEHLEKLFPNNIKGKTSLGGLKLQVKDWSIDIWSIQDTWAFRDGKFGGISFSDYPKITFLDIEAIAIQLFSKGRKKREIYSKGFFESISKKTIEINYEENPAPAECIIRALHIANEYKFLIGPKLAHYIVSHTNRIEIEELVEIYKCRYNSTTINTEVLHNCLNRIKAQIYVSKSKPIKVFLEKHNQFLEQHKGVPPINCDLFSMASSYNGFRKI